MNAVIKNMDRAGAETHVRVTKKPLLRTCSRGPNFLALSYWSEGREEVRHALVSVDNGTASIATQDGVSVFPSVQALALSLGVVEMPQ